MAVGTRPLLGLCPDWRGCGPMPWGPGAGCKYLMNGRFLSTNSVPSLWEARDPRCLSCQDALRP